VPKKYEVHEESKKKYFFNTLGIKKPLFKGVARFEKLKRKV